ncbi:MAG: fused MFS/spermidine synthase, partial [Nitrososphaerales archaeon]
LRAYINTLRQTFKDVQVVPAIASWRESPRVTFVILASQAPLDLDRFSNIDAGDGDTRLAHTVLPAETVNDILSEGKLTVLTDQYAPVDQMLAPVAREEATRPDAPRPQGWAQE